MTGFLAEQSSRRLARAFALLLLAPLLNACNSDFAAAVRQVTYPPDFVYVSGTELRSDMGRLGQQLARLDNALTAEQFGTPDQEAVLQSLRNMERIGAQLQSGGAGASHPFLEDAMPDFVSQVTRARLAASMDPPQYYLAGRVAGGCLGCHRINRSTE